MKTPLTRILLAALAVLMLLTAAACRKNPNLDPGYILNPSHTETPENEITAFLAGNEGSVEALAKSMIKSDGFLAYNYSYRMVDYDKGTMEFYVQKQEKTDGVWSACEDKDGKSGEQNAGEGGFHGWFSFFCMRVFFSSVP